MIQLYFGLFVVVIILLALISVRQEIEFRKRDLEYRERLQRIEREIAESRQRFVD